MAVTQVGICNSALAKVGQAPISSIAQDVRSAQILSSVWDLVSDEVLSAHPWNFAIKRAAWTPNATVPTYEYDYTYDLPSDCLRVLEVENGDEDGIEWAIEGRTLLCNEATLNVKFIYRNTVTSEWSPMFAEALAWRLAQEVSYALTQSIEREKQCEASYMRALSAARSVDGMEGTMKGIIADDWTTVRR